MNVIVVTGATGNVGRPLVSRLAAVGAHVRAVTRRPGAATFPVGVTAAGAVASALPGASAAFLNSRALGADLDGVPELAARHGLSRLVALSAINADDDDSRQPSRHRGDRNREVDTLVAGSGLDWVSLRPTVFMSNFAGMWGPQIRAGGDVFGPYAAASISPIADGDIGAVAAAALLTDDLVGRRVPLTGPQSLTNAEMADVIGRVVGRPVTYRDVAPDLVRQRFIDIGLGAQFADAYIAMLAPTVGRQALVTDDVERILGHPATTFEQWVAENCDLFTSEERQTP